jgi:hypothetical protein
VVQPWYSRGKGGENWRNNGPRRREKLEELEVALKKSKNGRAPVTDNLNVDLFKYVGTSPKDKERISFIQ